MVALIHDKSLQIYFFCVKRQAKNDFLKDVESIVPSKSRTLNALTLRKHACSIVLKILQPKKENFHIKNSDIFHISSHNIDYGYSLEPPRRSGSNAYPQSMYFSKIRKIMYTPLNPSFTILKWGLRGSKLYRRIS